MNLENNLNFRDKIVTNLINLNWKQAQIKVNSS